MSNLEQKHLGNGDNIGRDKNINIKFSYKLILIVIGILCLFYFKNNIRHYLKMDKIFDVKDKRFKILIVPFKVMLCKNEIKKDIGLSIGERLDEINFKDTLNIYPFYYDIPISDNFNADSAKYLQKYHNADQIIYGSYVDEKCRNTEGDDVCYNWITDEKWALDTLKNNIYRNYQVVTIDDLREGKIQGNTDYIIYWIAGLNAYSQVRYSKALKHWLYIYEVLKIQNITLVNNLGNVYAELADYEKALKLRKELLILSETSKDSLMAFNNLALVLKELGSYKEAKELLEKAMLSTERNFGKDHPRTAMSYSNLGLVFKDLGFYKEAKELLKRAMLSTERNFGKDHSTTAASYSNLGSVLKDLRYYEEAKELLEKAMLSTERNFGKDHPRTAVSYTNLGLVLKDLHYYEEAEKLLEKAMLSDERNFGRDHPTTAVSYTNLGLVLKDLRSYREAKELVEKAVLSDERNFGKDHPTTAVSYVNLAIVLKELGAYEEARELTERALCIMENKLPENHPNIPIVFENLKRINDAINRKR